MALPPLESAESDRTAPIWMSDSRSSSSHDPRSEHRSEEEIDEVERQREQPPVRSFQTGIGAILFALGTMLLLPISLPVRLIPSPVGSLAVILLATGTLLVGTGTWGRSV